MDKAVEHLAADLGIQRQVGDIKPASDKVSDRARTHTDAAGALSVGLPELPEQSRFIAKDFRAIRTVGSRDKKDALQFPITEIDTERTGVFGFGDARVVHQDGGEIRLNPSGAIEIKSGDGNLILRQHTTPQEQRFLERHGSTVNPADLAEIHYRYHQHPEWIDSFYQQMNRLEQCPALKDDQAEKLISHVVHNVASPGSVHAQRPELANIANLERYLVANSPTSYAGLIADVVRNGSVQLVDGEVRINRNSILQETADYANHASGIFQHAGMELLGKNDAGINVTQAALLAYRLTGSEHSVVRLSTSAEQQTARQVFGSAILAERVDNGQVRALFRGGDHRVEWEMKEGAPRVVPGSAREVANQRGKEQTRLRADPSTDRAAITPAEKSQLSAQTLAVRADEIHASLHKANFGIPAGDSQPVLQMLASMNAIEREHLTRIYGAKFATDKDSGNSNDCLKRELGQCLSPSDAASVHAVLDRQDGKSNAAGNFLVATSGLKGNDRRNSEKLMLQQLGAMSSAQIRDLDADLQKAGTSFDERVMQNKDLSEPVRESLEILHKGADQRTEHDVLQLADIAVRDRNIDVLATALGNNLEATVAARQRLQTVGADDRFKCAFRDHDLEIARDYLLESRISLATIAKQSKQWFWNNQSELVHALDSASDDEKQAFEHGRQVAETFKENPTSLNDADKEDLQFFNRVQNALRKDASERQFWEYQSKLLYDGSLLTDLAAKHSDGLGGSGLFGGHKFNELMTTTENMSAEQLAQFRDKKYFADFDKSLNTFCTTDERIRIETVIEQKLGRVSWRSASEITRPIQEIISDNETPEFAGLRIGRKYDGKAIIDGIKNIGLTDREHYQEDPNYRANVKQMLSTALEGPERLLAERMLSQVESGGARPVFNTVDQVLYDSISPPKPIDAVKHVQSALAEQKVLDPDLEKYCRKSLYSSVLQHQAMSQADERALEDKLINDGRLSLDDRLRFCTTSAERLNEITHCSEPEKERLLENGLKDDVPVIGVFLGQLNDDQRQYAEMVLRNRSLAGTDQLEDRVHYHVVSGDDDYGTLRDSFSAASGEQKNAAREQYATKYHRDLDKDLLGCVQDKDRLSFQRILHTEGTGDAQQEAFDVKLRALQSRSGFADVILASGHWDGSRDELMRGLDASVAMSAERAASGKPPDEEMLRRHSEFVAQSHTTFVKSKEGVTDVAVDAAYTAGGIGAAVVTGGVAAPLLIGAIGGGIARPAIKSAMQGEDFKPTEQQLVKEVAIGSVTGVFAAVGTEQVAQLMSVGKVASSKAMQSVSAVLGEATFKTNKDAVLALAEKELAKKVQAGLGHLSEKDLDHVVNVMIKNGMNEQLRPVVRAKLAHELNVQLDHGTRSYLESVIVNAKHLPRKLSFESALASSADATTQGTIGLTNWDEKATLSDNLHAITNRTVDAATLGALGGVKASATHFFTAPAVDILSRRFMTAIGENTHIQRMFARKATAEDHLATTLYKRTVRGAAPDGSDIEELVIPKLKDRPTFLVRDQHGFVCEVPNTKEYVLQPGDSLHAILPEGHFATRDGTILHPEATKARMHELATEHIPDAYKLERFKSFHQQFEARLPDAREQTLVAHELSRLLENKTGALDHDKSVWVAEQLARQLADPMVINQGDFPTCNTTVVETALALQQPSSYVRLLAEVAQNGSFRSADGVTTDVRPNNSFDFDRACEKSWLARANDNRVDDLGQTDRSFTSKLFQETAAQVRWDNEGGLLGRNYRKAGEVQIKFTRTNLMPYVGGNPVIYDGDLLKNPFIDSAFLPLIHEQIGGKESLPFNVVEHVDAGTHLGGLTKSVIRVTDADSLKVALRTLKEDIPCAIVVDAKCDSLRNDMNALQISKGLELMPSLSRTPEGHVVLAWLSKDERINVYNPWGETCHHVFDEAVRIEQLFAMMLRTKTQ